MILALALALSGCGPADDTDDAFSTEGWPLGEVVAVEDRGLRATLDTPQGPLHVVRLQGTHAEMGHQYGVLLADDVEPVWDALTGSMADDLGMDQEAVETLYGPMLDTVWQHMLPHTPAPWVEFFESAHAAMGYDEDDACLLCRVVVLANMSDMNFDSITAAMSAANAGQSEHLEVYYAEGPDAAARLEAEPPGVPGLFPTCSFFAAWGERTADGHMIASRNLDWAMDTGIGPSRALTLFVPEGEGAGHPFATVGYLGMVGALAGMSSEGVAVSEVGSTGVLERLTAEPWVLRNLDILEHATTLDEGLAYHANLVEDGVNRPQSIGYNFMVAWGDPAGEGAAAEAATVEANGAMASIHRGGLTTVHLFAEDGTHAEELVGTPEGEACEIDHMAVERTFACDDDGFVLDGDGAYVEDPDGCPLPTGLPLADALFRGDEAMSYHNRRFQLASHGPQGGDGLMVTSGSYTGRYLIGHDMLHAWETGSAWSRDGVEYIPAGEPTLVGLDEGVEVAQQMARHDNILSVVYDATSLELRLSYEAGEGETWVSAHTLDYFAVDLAPAFAWE